MTATSNTTTTAAVTAAAAVSTMKDANSLATLTAASTKLAQSDKKNSFSSRPVSTISGNSITSIDDVREAKVNMMDSQDSFSAMPTPRNTFLYPPTGINLSDSDGAHSSSKAPTLKSPTIAEWDSEQHQEQLLQLLDKNDELRDYSNELSGNAASTPASATAQKQQLLFLSSYDDSYCLLTPSTTHCAFGPDTREAAIAQLRRLADTSNLVNGSKPPLQPGNRVPLLLAPPADALSQLEKALMGVLARRNVPNRTHVYHSQRSGGAGTSASALASGATSAGSAALFAAATAGKSARRKQRMSILLTGQESSIGADDKYGTRFRISAMSGEIFSNLSSSTTPYTELNAHMDRLTACISKFQAVSPEVASAKSSGSVRAPSITGVQTVPKHKRQSSLSSLGAKSIASAHSGKGGYMSSDGMPPLPSYSDVHPRLSPVDENQAMEDGDDLNDKMRPRSSSAVSATSNESRRRINVTEVPTSSRFPGMFGLSLTPKSLAQDKANVAPSVAAMSVHSESTHTQASFDKAQQHPNGDSSVAPEIDRMMSFLTKPSSKSSSSSHMSVPAVTVREITPASRLALWLNMHSTAENSKPSLWRRKQWQRRFVIFAGNVLYLYKSSSPAATAISLIRLSPQTIVCVNDSFHGRSWVIEVTQTGTSDSQSVHGLSQGPQSWYLQTEMRSEMISLLKQLKGVVGELQVQPDMERKEEERLRSRRKTQRKEAKKKTDVCPWEVEEFSDNGSDQAASDDSNASDISEMMGLSSNSKYRIPDDELFPSDDEEPFTNTSADFGSLEAYSMSGVGVGGSTKEKQAAGLKSNDYTGTGGIAEWGAHRLHMPYSPTHALGMKPPKMRSFSTDPSAITGRRPSLADALAPPPSAMQELTPISRYSPAASPMASPMALRTRSVLASNSPVMRNSMMIKADASALIDQMFASASRELAIEIDESSTVGAPEDQAKPTVVSSGNNGLSVVREED
ncbi:hypothetical protein BX661DRAFT_176075 [Kickxella alabastrina]|uniref:uncharacterized protein n=1 Tax=Kickxella alabastrina TaxID=61397 RepID=UPI0022202BCD|nr:uncharacterized protein BX661DRAFT_176075 [Kickxella alabastrina]KAI7835099.1 hypothetical protein BX661DRAFT_176075 [Kickxella alabastrina]KAJ1947079.1 hypothetical protein GGF37_000715 [Kickxella alabastrina]